MSDLTARPFLDWYGVFACHVGFDLKGQAWLQEPPLGARLAWSATIVGSLPCTGARKVLSREAGAVG